MIKGICKSTDKVYTHIPEIFYEFYEKAKKKRKENLIKTTIGIVIIILLLFIFLYALKIVKW